MTTFQTKILFTFLPYILGYIIAYGAIAFMAWDRNAGNWMFGDRMFAVILGWVIGSMLYLRFEHDRVR